MSASEVARLLRDIEFTYQAARNGVEGLATGTARHDFIAAKMEHIDQQRKSLALLIGEEQAMAVVVQTLAHA